MKRPNPVRPVSHSGFTLLEVVIALGLFIFAITGLMGVIPYGMSQVQTASNESRGLTEMESIRDDVSLAMELKMAKSLRYGITPPAVGSTTPVAVDFLITENGEVATAGQNALFHILGTIRRSAANSSDPVYLNLRTTWPVKAPAGRETGSVDLVSAFRP